MLINLKSLINKYNCLITGVIHVGAHKAEEHRIYNQCNIDNVLWIEANSDLIPIIKRVVGNQQIINAVLWHEETILDYHQFTLTGSNSVLDANLNLTWRNDLKQVGTIKKQTELLRNIQGNQNFLNLDTQGAELNILKGTDLSKFDYIYTEVHKVETYKNCPMVWELDSYLTEFKRVETEWFKDRWGDAFYVRL